MQLFSNNAKTILTDTISASDVTLLVSTGTGLLFSSPTGTNYELLTITDGTNIEIVKLTSRSTDTFTVVRAQENTAARSWIAGASIEARFTAQTAKDLLNGLDHSGNSRGTDAINIQSGRDSVSQVASSTKAIAIGYGSKGASVNSIALGVTASSQRPDTWSASTDYTVGALISQTSATPSVIHRCITAGTSGASAPSWSTAFLGITTDGTAIWERVLNSTDVYSTDNAIAIGTGSLAGSGAAIAIGSKSASAGSGISIGENAFTAFNSLAMGYGAGAKYGYSIALGTLSLCGNPDGWKASTQYYVGSNILASGDRIFKLTNISGSEPFTSGSTEPTWTTTEGTSTVESFSGNNATWTYIGTATTSDGGGSVAIGDRSVATGSHSVVVGAWSTATYDYSTCIGYHSYAENYATVIGANSESTNTESVVIGLNASATYASGGGFGGIAIGSNAKALGPASCTVIGDYSENRIESTAVISGMHLVCKDTGQSDNYEHFYFTAGQNVILSKEINLKTVLDDASTITIPVGSTFYVDEIGVIVTGSSGVTVQPQVSFGITGNTTSILGSTATTKSTAKGRDIFTPISKDGINSLTASVKVGATATTLTGRFYWKGILVEDQ